MNQRLHWRLEEASLFFHSPSDDEVRQSDDEGPDGHQHAADRDDLWPVELGAEVTDERDHQQVSW